MKLYKDGSGVRSEDHAGTIPTADNLTQIGSSLGNGQWKGMIDELSIYNTVIDQGLIKLLSTFNLNKTDKNHWTLQTSDTSLIDDGSGYLWNGKINGIYTTGNRLTIDFHGPILTIVGSTGFESSPITITGTRYDSGM